MGGKSKSITVGYKYYMTMHVGIALELDAIMEWKGADRTAWAGLIEDAGSLSINAPELYGGEKREGGIQGLAMVFFGREGQGVSADLVSLQGTPQPDYLGFTGIVFNGQVAAMNPYLKPWSFRVRNIVKGWHGGTCWYEEKAAVPVAAGGSMPVGSGGWEYQQLPYHADPGHTNLVPPTDGWLAGGTGPFGDDNLWTRTPDLSVFWVRKTVNISGDGLTIHAAADNGCVLFVNGTMIGASNPDNEDISGNQNFPVDYPIPSAGYYEIVVKAYTESLSSDQAGNYLAVSITGDERQAMNPAHIIYQALTDPVWGMGYPTATIDDASFRAAADLFHAEGMGLCLKWNDQTSIEEFTQIIADHASLVYGQDRRTGLFRMLPLRQNYTVADLPVFTKADVKVTKYQRPALADTVNEVIIKYTDAATGKEAATPPLQNLANIQGQGRIVSQTLSFAGIPTYDLAVRVGMRELQARSTPLWQLTVEFKRKARNLLPGEPFVLDLLDTELGIRLVVRAGSINYGKPGDAKMTADCVEDVFGMPTSSYIGEQNPGSSAPSTTPKNPVAMAYEVPYYELLQILADDADTADPAIGYVGAVAVKADGAQVAFGFYTSLDSEPYAKVATGDYCPSALLAAAIGPTDTGITLDVATLNALDDSALGQALWLGNGAGAECVRLDAIDTTAGTATIGRGCADTVPNPSGWPAGTRLWGFDESSAFDPQKYATGETVKAKTAPQTGTGELPLEQVTELSTDVIGRHARPYPPATVKVNGASYPAAVDKSAGGAFTVTWNHRNRKVQADTLVDTTEASVAPAANTRYALRFLDAADALLVEQTNIGPGTADVILNTTGAVTMELYTIDDVGASYQKHVLTFDYTPPAGTAASSITATAYTPTDDSTIIDGGTI